jgi:hypothetical protein
MPSFKHSDIVYAPLHADDIDELAAVLLNDAVYEFIGGPPSADEFKLGLRHALLGPPASKPFERWLNFSVRLASTGQLIGRLEATLHYRSRQRTQCSAAARVWLHTSARHSVAAAVHLW